MSTPDPIVIATNLTKQFNELVAVDHINFDVSKVECFGFLGPNGAGKTSTVKMISCISPVTEGNLLIDGKDVSSKSLAIKALLGVVSQGDNIDPGLNVMQNLIAYGRYFGLPSNSIKERSIEMLELFQLMSRMSAKTDDLSGGLRRRLLIARALLPKPIMLVLDEPTTGLDPHSRHLLWDRLRLLKSEGVSVILTTHYMDEAAFLCDRLVIMDEGRIVVEGRPDFLVDEYAGQQVIEIHAHMKQKTELLDILHRSSLPYEILGDSVFVYGENVTLPLGRTMLDAFRVIRRPGNLEDVFLRLTGKGLRE